MDAALLLPAAVQGLSRTAGPLAGAREARGTRPQFLKSLPPLLPTLAIKGHQRARWLLWPLTKLQRSHLDCEAGVAQGSGRWPSQYRAHQDLSWIPRAHLKANKQVPCEMEEPALENMTRRHRVSDSSTPSCPGSLLWSQGGYVSSASNPRVMNSLAIRVGGSHIGVHSCFWASHNPQGSEEEEE